MQVSIKVHTTYWLEGHYLTHGLQDKAYIVNLKEVYIVYKILHHLKAISGKKKLFKKSIQSFKAYTNVDYAGLVVDKRSTLFLGW